MPRGRLIGFTFLLLSLTLSVLILTDIWPYLRGPAPGTSEWYWPHLLRPLTRWWPALLAGAGVAGVGWWWLGREEGRDAWPLAALVLLSAAMQLGLLYADRPAVGAELVDRTLSKASNGYVATAGEIEDLGDALRRFPELMATFDNDHARTHPPGFIAAHWLTDRALRLAPAAADWLARPATYWRCTDLWVLARTPATAAALLLWSWVPLLLAALLAVPVHRLAGRLFAPAPPRLATLLAATLPALLIFAPTPDQIFAFLSLLSLLWLVVGLRRGGWGSAVAAGLLVSLMTFLSLGNAAWAALLGGYLLLWVIWPNMTDDVQPDVAKRWAMLALFGLSAASLWLVYWLGWGVAPWEIARAGLGQHYELVTSLRRYDWWLGYNLLDFVLFAGPVVVAGLATAAILALSRPEARRSEAGRLALLLVGLLLAINVAGSTRGEVGRLWLVFMPTAALLAGGYFGRRAADRVGMWLLLVAQLVMVLSIGLGWRPFSAVILPVERPEWTATAPQTAMEVTFPTPDGRAITLIGIDQSPAAGDSLPVTLHWYADGATLRPYTVFVQLLDAAGQVVVQQDRWSVAGQWPTTCWRPGETVVDAYQLQLPDDLPPADYTLVTGLYDSATGTRLLTADGLDHVVLGHWSETGRLGD